MTSSADWQSSKLYVKPREQHDQPGRIVNTPGNETSTLKKDDPKTPHPKRSKNINLYDRVPRVWRHNAEMRDIWLRAQQMKAQHVEQVA